MPATRIFIPLRLACLKAFIPPRPLVLHMINSSTASCHAVRSRSYFGIQLSLALIWEALLTPLSAAIGVPNGPRGESIQPDGSGFGLTKSTLALGNAQDFCPEHFVVVRRFLLSTSRLLGRYSSAYVSSSAFPSHGIFLLSLFSPSSFVLGVFSFRRFLLGLILRSRILLLHLPLTILTCIVLSCTYIEKR